MTTLPATTQMSPGNPGGGRVVLRHISILKPYGKDVIQTSAVVIRATNGKVSRSVTRSLLQEEEERSRRAVSIGNTTPLSARHRIPYSDSCFPTSVHSQTCSRPWEKRSALYVLSVPRPSRLSATGRNEIHPSIHPFLHRITTPLRTVKRSQSDLQLYVAPSQCAPRCPLQPDAAPSPHGFSSLSPTSRGNSSGLCSERALRKMALSCSYVRLIVGFLLDVVRFVISSKTEGRTANLVILAANLAMEGRRAAAAGKPARLIKSERLRSTYPIGC